MRSLYACADLGGLLGGSSRYGGSGLSWLKGVNQSGKAMGAAPIWWR
jgi:hypothetical protein